MIDIVEVVVHGRKIGRALGYPTANMSLEGYEDVEKKITDLNCPLKETEKKQ